MHRIARVLRRIQADYGSLIASSRFIRMENAEFSFQWRIRGIHDDQDNYPVYTWYIRVLSIFGSFIRDDDEILQEQLSLCQYYW